jgi:L-iditol 2-dehydrogenase
LRAAVYYRNSDVRVERMPRPEIRAGEIIVRIEASGICGSDVMEWYRVKKAPLVLGHEIAGVVAEAGEGVKAFRPGDRVTVAHHVPCNTCRYCLRGDHSVCDTLRSTNFDPGGFAEYVRVPAINVDRGVFPVPEGLSLEEATFSEPLGCVLRALRAARMEAGKSVLVIGSGISGLLHIKLAAALGAGPIAATDVNPYRLDAARRFGAGLALDAREDVPARVRAYLGRGADVVCVCVAQDSAIDQAFRSVGRGGVILFFAPKEPGKTSPMPLFDLWRDNVTIVHSYASPPSDTLAALDILHARRLEVKDMITHRLPLAEVQRGFDLAVGGGECMKVIMEPQR